MEQGVSRSMRHPGRQAGVLFGISGVVVLLNTAVPGGTQNRPFLHLLGVVDLLIAASCMATRWERWSPRATLPLAPLALVLIGLANRYGGALTPDYGVYFVVVFAWLGMSHPPRTSLVMAIPATAAYVLPFVHSSVNQPDFSRSVGTVIPVCVMVGEVMASMMKRMRAALDAEERASAGLAVAMVTDDLTGLGNRRHGNRLLDSLRPGDALALLDLDKFKQVNDAFGHAEGDNVLHQLGDYLRGAVRESDEVARYGGEEFIIVLRRGASSAVEGMDRLLRGWRLQTPLTSFSVGIAVHGVAQSPALTFGQADAALYEAKRAGRDRVHLHGVETVDEPRPTLRVVGGPGG